MSWILWTSRPYLVLIHTASQQGGFVQSPQYVFILVSPVIESGPRAGWPLQGLWSPRSHRYSAELKNCPLWGCAGDRSLDTGISVTNIHDLFLKIFISVINGEQREADFNFEVADELRIWFGPGEWVSETPEEFLNILLEKKKSKASLAHTFLECICKRFSFQWELLWFSGAFAHKAFS